MARGRPAAAVGLILAAVLAGAVAVGRGDSGPAVRSIAVGQGPALLAVDEQARRVFVADALANTVSVLDARSGTLLRTAAVGANPDAIAFAEQAGRAFVLDEGDGTVSVLDARSGALVNTLPGTFPRRVSVDEATGRVFVASADPSGNFPSPEGSVSMLDARSGALLRTIPGGGPLAVDTRSGRLFVVVDTDKVALIDAQTGALLRTIRVGPYPLEVAVDAATNRVFVMTGGNGGNDLGGISVLDGASGRVVRTVPLIEPVGPPVVDVRRGRVFVMDTHGVRMLDAASGRPLRTAAISGLPLTMNLFTSQYSFGDVRIAAGDDALLLDGRDRRAVALTTDYNPFNGINRTATFSVSVVDAQSGRLLHTTPIVAAAVPPAIAVDEAAGRILVATQAAIDARGAPVGDGLVHVLDARSGRPLRTFPVGPGPSAIAVDESSGKAFVASSGAAPGTAMRAAGVWNWVPAWLRGRLPFLPGPAPSPVPGAGSVSMVDVAR